MSGYWSATSGTALIIPKEEAKDFFTRYLLETYRKDGVTDRDTACGKFVDVKDGSYIIYTDKSTRPQDLLGDEGYKSTEEIVKEFKEKLAAYVPDGFDWESHIGFFQCATFA